MTSEKLFQRLRDDLSPDADSKRRVRERMMSQMRASSMMQSARTQVTPDANAHNAIWSRVQNSIAPEAAVSAFDKVKGLLSPSADAAMSLRERVLAGISPRHRSYGGFFALKWASAFMLIAIVVRISPLLFLAPRTVAESSVLAVPTQGVSSVLIQGFWQPVTHELQIADGARFRTAPGGGLTLILHDDGNVRLGSGSTIALYDASNRPEPALNSSTLLVESGQVWVQGLLPGHLRALTISTPAGDVLLTGGSVSVKVGDTVRVSVWDGHASVTRDGQPLATVVAGETIDLWNQNIPAVKRMAENADMDPWVKQNLSRDATHRREVAQWQQERRAARAGILPTSPLYPVKRVAERVDMLLTFDEHERLEKRLDLASTRLNEAAALIAQGESGATIPLEEYKAELKDIGTGSGTSTVAQFLLRQAIAENTAQLSAATPEDDVYALKRFVLETGAGLPEDVVDERDVQGTLLVDTLSVVNQAVNSGDIDRAKKAFAELQPYLDSLQGENDELKPEVRREALSLLSTVAAALGEGEQVSGSGSMQKDLLKEVVAYVPKVKPQSAKPALTQEQIQEMVQDMFDRIFLYKQPRARWNQLQYEMAQLQGHPDRGTILRHLYHALPEDGLARYVRTEIQEMRQEMQQGEGE